MMQLLFIFIDLGVEELTRLLDVGTALPDVALYKNGKQRLHHALGSLRLLIREPYIEEITATCIDRDSLRKVGEEFVLLPLIRNQEVEICHPRQLFEVRPRQEGALHKIDLLRDVALD